MDKKDVMKFTKIYLLCFIFTYFLGIFIYFHPTYEFIEIVISYFPYLFGILFIGSLVPFGLAFFYPTLSFYAKSSCYTMLVMIMIYMYLRLFNYIYLLFALLLFLTTIIIYSYCILYQRLMKFDQSEYELFKNYLIEINIDFYNEHRVIVRCIFIMRIMTAILLSVNSIELASVSFCILILFEIYLSIMEMKEWKKSFFIYKIYWWELVHYVVYLLILISAFSRAYHFSILMLIINCFKVPYIKEQILIHNYKNFYCDI